MRNLAKAILAAIAAMFVAIPALAAPTWTNYSAERFASAQAAGRTIVVDVHADWCPTCKAQAPILETLRNDKRLENVTFMRVDFDTEKDFLRTHRVPRQSTILVFKGKQETGRSIAETDPARLRSFVLQAVR